MPVPARRTFTDVACTVCGCVCDDLRVTVEQGRIVEAVGACELARPWFFGQSSQTGALPEIGGRPAPWEEAYARAAAILKASRAPLIYGLSRSTTEGQRAAAALADFLGATIDTTASTGHAPSIVALQQVGESTCTLGEVKGRADLVIFWGSDPVVTHPRQLERYCPPPAKLVVVDAEKTATAERAGVFLRIPADGNWDALWTLRMLVKGIATEASPELIALAEMMKACHFGVVFFGSGLTQGRLAHRTIEALLQLVTDLNDHTEPETRRRFYARRMRRYGDVAGADSVLTWQTGYPFGVNFAAGYPRYNPGEFTAPELLARGEVDAALILGAETTRGLPPEALAALERIPAILLDAPTDNLPFAPAVRFPTAVYGIHRPGTAYRLDELAIPLKVLLPTDCPSDADVLRELHGRVDR
jgi:formylmethanofuran dehydrogenase subunit B